MRSDPDPTAPERELLAQYLDLQRDTMVRKSAGLSTAQLALTLPPSTLTIGGLLFHLALVEESWLEVRFRGLPVREPWLGVDWEVDPDWEFATARKLHADAVRQRYEDACTRSRRIAESAESLDELSVATFPDGQHFSLRWVLLHLIEETARHAGHADLLREAIDGAVGE